MVLSLRVYKALTRPQHLGDSAPATLQSPASKSCSRDAAMAHRAATANRPDMPNQRATRSTACMRVRGTGTAGAGARSDRRTSNSGDGTSAQWRLENRGGPHCVRPAPRQQQCSRCGISVRNMQLKRTCRWRMLPAWQKFQTRVFHAQVGATAGSPRQERRSLLVREGGCVPC